MFLKTLILKLLTLLDEEGNIPVYMPGMKEPDPNVINFVDDDRIVALREKDD
ncbi:MAG: hypothetical protein KKD77_20545 [Gammaproteobacteria bacterium]|nr:hypothetical protein [Gammaproteobacteria bacterium]